MVVIKFLVAAIAALNVVSIQASPCKISSSSTTNELSTTPSSTPSASGSSTTPQVTPTSSETTSTTPQVTPTSSETTSTTPQVTPTSSETSSTTPQSTPNTSGSSTTPQVTPTSSETTPQVTPTSSASTTTPVASPTTPSGTPTPSPQPTCVPYTLKNPFPNGDICGGIGHSTTISGFQGDIFESMTLGQCAERCHNTPGCFFFAHNPGQWCELWSEYPGRDTDQTPWSWYNLDCFDTCDADLQPRADEGSDGLETRSGIPITYKEKAVEA